MTETTIKHEQLNLVNDVNTDEAATVKDRINALLPHASEIEILGHLGGGWSNANYHLVVDNRHLVFRHVRTPKNTHVERQYLDLNFTPTLIAFDDVRGDLLTEWVEGDLVVHAPMNPQVAASYLKDLHKAIPMDINKYDVLTEIRNFYDRANADKTESALFNLNTWSPKFPIGCHNDLNPYNIIKTKNGFVTLDWESAGVNDAYFDLAGLCYGLGFNDEEFQECIETYDNILPEYSYIVGARRTYMVREHAWALCQVRTGNDTPNIQNQILTSVTEIERLDFLHPFR